MPAAHVFLVSILAFQEKSGIGLIDTRMGRPQGRGKDPPEECATAAEVMAAIESLSAEQDYRLKKYAGFRVRGLGRAAMGRTYDALLAEAVVATLRGAEGGTEGRKWAKNRVPFVDHLLGAIRSISTHWAEAYERRGTEAERFDWQEAREDDEGNLVRPTEEAVDPGADPFRSCAANELLEALDRQFAEDEDAWLVIEGRKKGMAVPEMVADFGLTEKKVNAAMQRVRYFMERFL